MVCHRVLSRPVHRTAATFYLCLTLLFFLLLFLHTTSLKLLHRLNDHFPSFLLREIIALSRLAFSLIRTSRPLTSLFAPGSIGKQQYCYNQSQNIHSMIKC